MILYKLEYNKYINHSQWLQAIKILTIYHQCNFYHKLININSSKIHLIFILSNLFYQTIINNLIINNQTIIKQVIIYYLFIETNII